MISTQSKSGRVLSQRLNASLPSRASTTSKPSGSTHARSESSVTGSSSAKRIFMLEKLRGEDGRPRERRREPQLKSASAGRGEELQRAAHFPREVPRDCQPQTRAAGRRAGARV